MIYTADPERGRVFVHAEQPSIIVTVTAPGTVGAWLDESELIELLATVQDRPTQLGVDGFGDL